MDWPRAHTPDVREVALLRVVAASNRIRLYAEYDEHRLENESRTLSPPAPRASRRRRRRARLRSHKEPDVYREAYILWGEFQLCSELADPPQPYFRQHKQHTTHETLTKIKQLQTQLWLTDPWRSGALTVAIWSVQNPQGKQGFPAQIYSITVCLLMVAQLVFWTTAKPILSIALFSTLGWY